MQPLKPFFFLFLTSLLSVAGLTQKQAVKDSLLNRVAVASRDSSLIPVLLSLQEQYLNKNNDSALYYLKQSEELILKTGATHWLHKCYHGFVKVYHAESNYTMALKYNLKMVETAKAAKDPLKEAFSYRTLFNVYHNLRMNDSAVKYAIQSLKMTEELKDTFNLATNYGNLCWLYMDLNQFKKAIEFGIKGIESGEKFKDTTGWLIALNNLSLCYHRTGENLVAISHLKKQLELGKLVNRRRSVERALVNLSTCYFHLGDATGLSEITEVMNRELDANPTSDSRIMSYREVVNGYNQLLQGKLEPAESFFKKSVQIALEDSLVDNLQTAYSLLAMVKAAQKDFKASLFYNDQWDKINMLSHERELSEYGMELEKVYETKKMEGQLQMQQTIIRQKSRMSILLLVGIALLVLLIILAYRNFRHRQQLHISRINQLEQEKQLSATEAVLKGEEQERTRLAKDLHDGLGGMLSGIKYSFQTMKENLSMTPENQQAFGRSLDMLDSSIKEMRRVAHNLMPEVLVHYGLDAAIKDFTSELKSSGIIKVVYQSMGMENKKIEQSLALGIYRIVQELLNNVVKHSEATEVLVQLFAEKEKLVVNVEDNGKGMEITQLEKTEGMGWKNIRLRTGLLNGNTDIQSEPGKGTAVNLEFMLE